MMANNQFVQPITTALIARITGGVGNPEYFYRMRRKTLSFSAKISGADPVVVNPAVLIA